MDDAVVVFFEARKKALLEEMRRRAYKEGSVTLSSGLLSNFYINCKKILTPLGLTLIAEIFTRIILEYAPTATAVGGLTMGADPLSCAVSLWSKIFGTKALKGFYVRKEPKKHGTQDYIEGPDLDIGEDVVILEDVITTGASAIKAIKRVQEMGLRPILVLALVDRQEENGRQNIEALGLRVEALFTKEDFVS